MSYEVPVAPGEKPDEVVVGSSTAVGSPLWEVFVRAKRGLSHTHVGSLHAPDAESAISSWNGISKAMNNGSTYSRNGLGTPYFAIHRIKNFS